MKKKCASISVRLAPTHSAPQRVGASVGFQLSAAQIITTSMSIPVLQRSCVHRHHRKVLDSQQYPIAARLLRKYAPDVKNRTYHLSCSAAGSSDEQSHLYHQQGDPGSHCSPDRVHCLLSFLCLSFFLFFSPFTQYSDTSSAG